MATNHAFNCCGPCCEPVETFLCGECGDVEVSGEGEVCAECAINADARDETADDSWIADELRDQARDDREIHGGKDRWREA